ncbi:WD40/YVTN/BNR-like repeat-containing protein [Halobacterium wangiae]|uniref:WD40/YVTN/BNR-like repeat-containing protein n=1 Tax=Halobacterium wangiae TaxID=2902623 RepID=UPI001E3620E9|nr:WD40 repeat domain-containing protein [Halobacterium wangiae]
MLIAGTGDGAYSVTGLAGGGDTAVAKVLDAPRVERVRQFDAVDGVFAATKAGLYYSRDGSDWVDLRVPEETVYAVVVSPDGERIYAGTRPTHVYVSSLSQDGHVRPEALDWRELAGFRDLPSRDEWGVPRHDNVAKLRSLCAHPDSPDRIVAGVEPGGVHVSEDRGETWDERSDGVHDDVHKLYTERDRVYVAATGVGLYRSTDVGRSWTRLDETVEQRYFRSVYSHDGVLYTSAACVPPNRWDQREADPAVFQCRDGTTLAAVAFPCPDEVVVGWTTVGDDLVAVTHRGTVLRRRDGGWTTVADIQPPDTLPGRYCNLTWYEP